MLNRHCTDCNSFLEIENWKCDCRVPNLLQNVNPVMRSYIDLYAQFAEDDLAMHFQDENFLKCKAQIDFSIIQKHIKNLDNKRVLEIGPGMGHLSSLFPPASQYFCMDVVPNYLTRSNKKNFLANIENAPLLFHDFFDLIIACDVFEHVLNEGNAWEGVRKMLKNDGLFYLRVPNMEPLIHYVSSPKNNFPFVHLRNYSSKVLKMNAYNHGFEPRRISGLFFGKFSYAKRSFGLKRNYRRNAEFLRRNLDLPNISSAVIDTKPNINPLKKIRFLRSLLIPVHSFFFYRKTELVGIFKKAKKCA